MAIPNTNYLVQIKARSGFYFQRKVPADLQKQLGKKHWRMKAGNTVQEARRFVVQALLDTDAEIAQARGTITPELKQWIDNKPTVSTDQLSQALQQQGLTPEEIYPRFSEEDAHKLVRSELGEGAREISDLLELAKRLKDPAPSTYSEWVRHATKFMEVARKEEINELTDDDARKYRDHLLDSVSGSTAKTRLRYLKSLFDVAVDEAWMSSNPFNVINMRYIKSKPKVKEARLLDDIDKKVREGSIPDYQAHLYWIMRFTGTHVSEAAGLRHEDIDLEKGVIHIRPNELRQVKNAYRERVLPILDELKEVLVNVKNKEKGYIFPGLYDERCQRWGNGMSWHRRLGVSPKACRDAVATQLRDANINERVLGSVLGHTPKTSTGLYGSVSLEAKREALMNLIHQPGS